jgi:hypothetical protein
LKIRKNIIRKRRSTKIGRFKRGKFVGGMIVQRGPTGG